MTDCRYANVQYEYRGYTYGVVQPERNQITASAFYFMKEFIENTGSLDKMEDWLLTKRQNQIMALMAEGKDKQEIADILNVETTTITSQIVDIYSRYGLDGGFKPTKAVIKFLKNTGKLDVDDV